jgi:multiple sugar transport system ATP-binding protein
MNIFPGRVTENGIFVAGTANVAMKADAPIGTEISYGLRPDDVAIGGEGSVSAEVLVVEPTGAETHVTARLGGHEITIVSKRRLDTKPGDVLPISLTSEHSHLFEASTGRRI